MAELANIFEAAKGHENEEPARASIPDGKNETNPKPSNLELEFLPEYLEIMQRPPSRVARYFAISIILLCIAVIAWATLGHIDIIASSPGRLIIGDRSKVIQAPHAGEVSGIHVRDGQKVGKGELLIEFNSKSSVAEKERLSNQVISMRLEKARINALLSDSPEKSFTAPQGVSLDRVEETHAQMLADASNFKTRRNLLRSEITQLNLRLELMKAIDEGTEALLANAQKRLESREDLFSKGYLPSLEILELQREVIQSAREVAQNKASAAQLKSEQIKLEDQIKQLEAENQKALLDKLLEVRSNLYDLRKQLVQAAEIDRMMRITSPVDGVIQQLNVSTVGGVVQPAQDLMIIVPEVGNLQAEVNILNKDIGFIQSGQLVEVKIDSFPYTKYGTIKGEVLHISRDAANDEKLGLVYPARIRLATQAIQTGGEKIRLSAGMTLTAEIKTGNRRIITYVLSPLQEYQSESLRER